MPMIEARSRLLSGAVGGFLRAKNKITNANHDNNTTANASVGQKFKWMTIIVKPDSRGRDLFHSKRSSIVRRRLPISIPCAVRTTGQSMYVIPATPENLPPPIAAIAMDTVPIPTFKALS